MDTSLNKTIACHLHDYFEAACVYQYQLQIIKRDGSQFLGKALDINCRDGIEYLSLENLKVNNRHQEKIDLLTIKQVNVITPNAKFTSWKMP